MKKSMMILTLVGTISAVFADSNIYDGYSYGGIGIQNVTYKEHGVVSLGAIDNKASGTSPIYTTGSLVKVNDKYDFSLDFASTLLPSKINETWNLNGTPIMKDDYDLLTATAQVLVHYKLTPQHRLVAGPYYILNTYKRYNQTAIDPTKVSVVPGVTEESAASLNAVVGYWYESAPAAVNGWRFRGVALGSVPVWQKTTNTSSTDDLSFSDRGGYNIDASAYAGYTVFKGLEIGLTVGCNYQSRDGGGPKTDSVGNNVYWPENTLTTYYGTLNAVWNFSRP